MAKITKEAARKAVPSYISPRDCFVWHKNSKEGYMVIPGTPCAHYVSHQLELTGKSACCDEGYLIRVSDVVAALTEIKVEDVQVNDVWARQKGDSGAGGKEPTNHCGMVVGVERDPAGAIVSITIRHNSSRQKKVAENDWKTYFKGGGKFYTKSATIKSPREQAKASRLKRGLPYKDELRIVRPKFAPPLRTLGAPYT
jgi:hypothetical protein